MFSSSPGAAGLITAFLPTDHDFAQHEKVRTCGFVARVVVVVIALVAFIVGVGVFVVVATVVVVVVAAGATLVVVVVVVEILMIVAHAKFCFA